MPFSDSKRSLLGLLLLLSGGAVQASSCPESFKTLPPAPSWIDAQITASERAHRLQQTVPLAQLREVIQEAKKTAPNSFCYPLEGCFARAHLLADELESRGYSSRKIFVHPGEGKDYLEVALGKSSEHTSRVAWDYHVAVLVEAPDAAGTVREMVLDPVLFAGPVERDRWESHLSKLNPGVRVRVAPRFAYGDPAVGQARTDWYPGDFEHAMDTIEQMEFDPALIREVGQYRQIRYQDRWLDRLKATAPEMHKKFGQALASPRFEAWWSLWRLTPSTFSRLLEGDGAVWGVRARDLASRLKPKDLEGDGLHLEAKIKVLLWETASRKLNEAEKLKQELLDLANKTERAKLFRLAWKKGLRNRWYDPLHGPDYWRNWGH